MKECERNEDLHAVIWNEFMDSCDWHVGAAWENGQYLRTRDPEKTRKAFEDRPARLGTDYLDIGMVHYVDGAEDFEKMFQGDFFTYCRELKAQGRIRCLGLSSHNPLIARNAGSYKDGADGIDPERKALYELCEREGSAIDVMKAFGGGDMLDEGLSPFGAAFNEYQCIDYCLTRPGWYPLWQGVVLWKKSASKNLESK